MRKITAASAAFLTAALLTGCGGSGDTDNVATGNTDKPAAASKGDRADSLKDTAQGYYDAMIKGNIIGMSAYARAGECEDDFGGMMMFGGAEMFKQMFDGVTKLRVTEVKVDGDRGEVVDGKIEGKVSDSTKRLFEGDDSGEEPDYWKYVDGKWWKDCTSTATPTATATTT